MRTVFIAALTALGLALAGTSTTWAAPASSIGFGNAAHTTRLIDQAQWRWHRHYRHHRHCWVGPYGRLHCGWW